MAKPAYIRMLEYNQRCRALGIVMVNLRIHESDRAEFNRAAKHSRDSAVEAAEERELLPELDFEDE